MENFENQKKQNSANKESYSMKEFSVITGLKYSTVLFQCKTQRLKTRQDGPNGLLQILSSEIDRYKNDTNN